MREFSQNVFGLSEENVISALRDRLQAAHLVEDASAEAKLFARAHMTSKKCRINVIYSKPVRDLISGEEFFADTWKSESSGDHGNDGNHILSRGMNEMDKFIDEYMRVNRDSCGKR